MKRLYVHGTSFEAGQSILKNGFGKPENKRTTTTWSVSEYDSLYLRCLNHYDIYNKNNYDVYELSDDEDISVFYEKVIRESLWNATITAAFQNSQSEKVYLFFFLLDDENDTVLDDCSCPGMSNCWEVSHKIANENCIGNLLLDCYIPLFRVFYFPCCNSEVFNNDALEISKHEEMLLSACEDNFTIFEELEETRMFAVTSEIINKISEFAKSETALTK